MSYEQPRNRRKFPKRSQEQHFVQTKNVPPIATSAFKPDMPVLALSAVNEYSYGLERKRPPPPVRTRLWMIEQDWPLEARWPERRPAGWPEPRQPSPPIAPAPESPPESLKLNTCSMCKTESLKYYDDCNCFICHKPQKYPYFSIGYDPSFPTPPYEWLGSVDGQYFSIGYDPEFPDILDTMHKLEHHGLEAMLSEHYELKDMPEKRYTYPKMPPLYQESSSSSSSRRPARKIYTIANRVKQIFKAIFKRKK